MVKVINDRDISVLFNDNVYNGRMLKCKGGVYFNLAMPKNLYTHWQICSFDGIYTDYIVQVDDNATIFINLN